MNRESVAGWTLFLCISRARPASKYLKGLNPLIAPATGLDSEAKSRHPKGTFKARTSKSKFFSQFVCLPPLHGPKSACAAKCFICKAEDAYRRAFHGARRCFLRF